MSQTGLDLREERANLTKMQRTALTALEPLVFPRISTEITLVLAVAVDGMLGQPVGMTSLPRRITAVNLPVTLKSYCMRESG